MINRTEEEIKSGWSLPRAPLVSICCITYNHEKFITEAIDSFLMQITTFPFEIIIGEDCSTDGTMHIIKHYEKEYPHLIKVLTNDTNIGMQKNFERTFNSCQSRYIALCEGDDYWTDTYKLQKQITFLENNPEYSICCHISENYDEKSQTVISNFPKIVPAIELTIFDLFNANIAHTCTFVYRNKNVEIPSFFEKLRLADWPLHIIHAAYGKIKLFPENMARYRIHQNGIWSSINVIQQLDASIMGLKYIDDFFQKKYSTHIQKSITRHFLEKALIYLELNQPAEASQCYKESSLYSKINFLYTSKYFIKKNFSFCYPLISFVYRTCKRTL